MRLNRRLLSPKRWTPPPAPPQQGRTATVAEVRMLTATRRHVGPLQAVLESISNKWVATVLELLTGARELSYGELHRQTNGVSRKMLSATLRDLVRDGLVQRRAEPDDASRRVYYFLTDLGRSLVATLDGLRTWAHANMDVIDAARRTYDGSLELAQLP